MDIIYAMQKEMVRRKYSIRTINTYCDCVRVFLRRNHKEFQQYGKKDITDFLDDLCCRGASASTMNVYLNALKFMMHEVLRKNWQLRIKTAKTPKTLPVVLTKQEVVGLFEAIDNPKHLLMIKFMYSAGLRVSELLNLKVRDLDLGESYGWVCGGKGNKDRMFIIAKSIRKELAKWIYKHGLKDYSYLFSAYESGMRMSSRTVQEIVKKATKKAIVGKKVHPHTLRHSFATHLIENDCSVTDVQLLLGHRSPDTTTVYIHTASRDRIDIKSPLDEL